MTSPEQNNSHDERVRPHTYDGIEEYDRRLPNWWLFTLYGAIAFSFFYWIYFHQAGIGLSDDERLALGMAALAERRAASAPGDAGDDLRSLAGRSEVIASGRDTYAASCASCHGPELEGGIGVSLVKTVWSHGGEPEQILEVVATGVPAKGMPGWQPILGDRKIAEVVAFILSRQAGGAEAASGDGRH
jgi:cytochrome c oxidase cbb3-type subunit III